MGTNYSFGGRRERGGNRLMLAALVVAYEKLRRPDATDDELKQVASKVLCEFCRANIPVENGKHKILGAEIDCEAV